MNVLVTGFEPFLDEKVNPTQAIAEFVNSCDFHQGHPTLSVLNVRGLVLPVEFDRAFRLLEKERLFFLPEVIVSFGLAGGREGFEIEMLAVNQRGGGQTERGDNTGKILSGPINQSAPKVLGTTLPVEAMLTHLSAVKVPSRKSYSAGTYVCNDLFFQTQERLRFTRVRSGFIHVPRMLQADWPMFEAAVMAILQALVTDRGPHKSESRSSR